MIVELMRHGQTTLQAEHRYVGSTDDPLSPQGAASLRPSTQVPAQVYVSRRRRTAQTADLVFPGARQLVVPGMEEMDFGKFEGRTVRELERDPAYRAWVDGMCEGRCPGGESKDEFERRACAAFLRLMDQAMADGKNRVVVVTHGGTIMAVMARYGIPRREFFSWRVEHGCGIALDADDWTQARTLRLIKETDHRGKEHHA